MPVPKPAINTKHPSPNRNGYAGKRRVDAVIWHVTAGGEAGSLSWLTNPDSGASANYLIGKDGTTYELVPPTDDAWANGAVNKPDTTNPLIPKWQREGANFNQRTVSIEVARETSAQGQPGGFTPAQYKALVTLTAWLCQEFRLTPDRVHIFGHRTIDSVNRPNCPGLAESEWFALVAAVAALVNGATPPPVPTQPNAGSVVEAPQPVQDGAVRWYLNDKQEPIVEINFGGRAKAIEGVNLADVGVSVIGTDDATYDRSLQAGAFKPYTKQTA